MLTGRERVGRLVIAAATATLLAACTGGERPEQATDEPSSPMSVTTNEDAVESAAVDQAALDVPLVSWTFIPVEDMTVEPGHEFNPQHIAAVGDLFVAVGGHYTDGPGGALKWVPVSWHSNDGREWELGGLIDAAAESGIDAEVKRLVPLHDRLLAVGLGIADGPGGIPTGDGTVVYESFDGVTWQYAPPGSAAISLAGPQAALASSQCLSTARAGVDGVDDAVWLDSCQQQHLCSDDNPCGPVRVGRGSTDEGTDLVLGDDLRIFQYQQRGAAHFVSTLPHDVVLENAECTQILDDQFLYGDQLEADVAACEERRAIAELPTIWRSTDNGLTWGPQGQAQSIAELTPELRADDENPVPYLGTYTIGSIGVALEFVYGASDVPVIGTWATVDDGDTWQYEPLEPFAADPELSTLVGTSTEFMALATATAGESYTAGVFLGTLDRKHPLVDVDQLPDPRGATAADNDTSDVTAVDEGESSTATASLETVFPECAAARCEPVAEQLAAASGGSFDLQAFNIVDDMGYVIDVGFAALDAEGEVAWSARLASGFGIVIVDSDATGNQFYVVALTNHSAALIVVNVASNEPSAFGTVDGPILVESFTEGETPGVFDLIAPRQGWPDNTDPGSLVDVYVWTGSGYDYAGCRPRNTQDPPSLEPCDSPVAQRSVEL